METRSEQDRNLIQGNAFFPQLKDFLGNEARLSVFARSLNKRGQWPIQLSCEQLLRVLFGRPSNDVVRDI